MTQSTYETPAGAPIDAYGRNPFLSGNFGPIDFETTAYVLPVKGQIPRELTGRLVRIGPNPSDAIDLEHYHWFNGIGMLHGVRMIDGRAEWYRSRYVRAGTGAESIGLKRTPGDKNESEYSAVNTHVVRAGDRMFAVVEAGGLPVELSYELDSLCRSNLQGGARLGFTAHPKMDPFTGELHALAYQPGNPLLQYLVVDTLGVARQAGEIWLPHMPQVHDIGITRSSVIVLDLPVTFQPQDGRPGGGFPYRWNPTQQPRVGLLPRQGGSQVQWFDAPACYVFHFLNAYDDGDCVIADVCRHPKMFASETRGANEGKPILARWVMNRTTGRLSENILDDHGSDFPRINSSREGLPYRYGYTAGWGPGLTFGPSLKHDLQTGRTEVHNYGKTRAALEPVFVPRKDGTDEDDGWILSYVYDGERDKSDVVILAGKDFTGEPIATIQLPVRVPYGFHGAWFPDQQ